MYFIIFQSVYHVKTVVMYLMGASCWVKCREQDEKKTREKKNKKQSDIELRKVKGIIVKKNNSDLFIL